VATYAPLVVLDVKIANWLHQHGTPEITAFMIAVTTFHAIAGTSILATLFGVVLAGCASGTGPHARPLDGGRDGVEHAPQVRVRARAAVLRRSLGHPHTYSFPSGHTAGAVLFYGVLIAFLVSRFNAVRQRVPASWARSSRSTLVAFSRMYLGAHYLSDVLAAACSSAVWLVLCLSAVHALVRRRRGDRSRRASWACDGSRSGESSRRSAYSRSTCRSANDWRPRSEAPGDGPPHRDRALRRGGDRRDAPPRAALALQILAGAVFGFLWGTVAALAASLGGALAAFLISRYFFRGRVRAFVRRRKAFKAFDEAVARESWKIVALMRLSPIASSGMKSYFLRDSPASTPGPMRPHRSWAPPGLLLDVYIGDAGRHALSGGLVEWSLLAAGIAATVAVGVILGRITRKRLDFAF
jgi:undecaprenyl-diphosphatase